MINNATRRKAQPGVDQQCHQGGGTARCGSTMPPGGRHSKEEGTARCGSTMPPGGRHSEGEGTARCGSTMPPGGNHCDEGWDSKHEILCDTSAWTTFLCGANVSSKTNLPSAYNALPDVERGGQSKQNNRIGGLGRPPEQGKSHY
eukprot:1158690-Pelagomonas_calceolata.AAC.3